METLDVRYVSDLCREFLYMKKAFEMGTFTQIRGVTYEGRSNWC